MNNYFFIHCKDALEGSSLGKDLDLMMELLGKNHEVDLLLVQDGIYVAQQGVNNKSLKYFIGKGGRVHVDDFSLKIREISASSLIDGVVIDSIGIVVDALIGKNKVIWS